MPEFPSFPILRADVVAYHAERKREEQHAVYRSEVNIIRNKITDAIKDNKIEVEHWLSCKIDDIQEIAKKIIRSLQKSFVDFEFTYVERDNKGVPGSIYVSWD